MLKTNSKKAKENVRKYILDNITYDYWNEEERPEEGNFKEIAKAIKKSFFEEKIRYDKRKNLSIWDYFEEWCSGLPSCLDTCYYYNRSAIKDLGDILEETEEERSNFTETAAEKCLTRLIFKELHFL